MPWKQTNATFRAIEAEKITGISREMQRSLRKRGFLPAAEGWAAFDVKDLTFLYVIGRLAAANIGPKAAERISRTAALVIRYRAIHLPGAVSDPERLRGDEPLIHLPPKLNRRGVDFPEQPALVVFTDGSAEYADEGEILSVMRERTEDVAFVFDLDAAAQQIVARADRPLVLIQRDE